MGFDDIQWQQVSSRRIGSNNRRAGRSADIVALWPACASWRGALGVCSKCPHPRVIHLMNPFRCFPTSMAVCAKPRQCAGGPLPSAAHNQPTFVSKCRLLRALSRKLTRWKERRFGNARNLTPNWKGPLRKRTNGTLIYLVLSISHVNDNQT